MRSEEQGDGGELGAGVKSKELRPKSAKHLRIKNRALRVVLPEGSVFPVARTATESPENKEGLVHHHNPSSKKVISFSFWLSFWPSSWLP